MPMICLLFCTRFWLHAKMKLLFLLLHDNKMNSVRSRWKISFALTLPHDFLLILYNAIVFIWAFYTQSSFRNSVEWHFEIFCRWSKWFHCTGLSFWNTWIYFKCSRHHKDSTNAERLRDSHSELNSFCGKWKEHWEQNDQHSVLRVW